MIDFNNLTIYLKVNYVLMWIHFAMGIVGIASNVLLMCVFLRKSLRRNSYSFYSLLKACGDILVLFYTFRNWSNYIHGANLDLVAPILCVMNNFVPYFAGNFSLIMLVIISLDRLLSVVYPTRFEWTRKKRFQASAALLVVVYACGNVIVLPLNAEYMTYQVGNVTIHRCQVSSNEYRLFWWISNLQILVITMVINNALNIKLISFVISSRKKVSFSTSQQSQARSLVKERKMMVSSIGLGMTALVTHLPLGLVPIISNYLDLPVDQNIMVNNISLTFLVFEKTASFFVNFFLNSMFHDELMEMIRLKRGSTTTVHVIVVKEIKPEFPHVIDTN